MYPTGSFASSTFLQNAIHLSPVNLLLSAAFNDNMMKGFPAKKVWSHLPYSTCMTCSCILFWPIEAAVSRKHCACNSPAVSFSKHHCRCKVVGLQMSSYFCFCITYLLKNFVFTVSASSYCIVFPFVFLSSFY